MSSRPIPLPGEFLATVGVFDGLHLGHHTILEPLLAEARERGLPPVLFTFHPRPVTVFAPGTPPDELTPMPRKLRLLAEAGIERVVVLRFSQRFAAVEAEEFLTDVLGAGNGLKGIWIGHDFRFGRRRRGNPEMLREAGSKYGFTIAQVGPFNLDGAPVSSTRVREQIHLGAIPEAARLIGRWPDIEGLVVGGRGEGHKLLVATANLLLPETQCLPATGVYAGEAEWDGNYRPAVMNLGWRPTLTDGSQLVPEVHILDFSGDLRGKRLLFRMRQHLRGESTFLSLNELRVQIEEDIDQTRRIAENWKRDE